jgi:hypothetical protein
MINYFRLVRDSPQPNSVAGTNTRVNTNGGFEAQLLTTNSVAYFRNGDTGLSGWNIAGVASTLALINGLPTNSIGPAEGAQFVVFNTGLNPIGQKISQTLDTTAATVYSVRANGLRPVARPTYIFGGGISTRSTSFKATSTSLPSARDNAADSQRLILSFTN